MDTLTEKSKDDAKVTPKNENGLIGTNLVVVDEKQINPPKKSIGDIFSGFLDDVKAFINKLFSK